MISSGPFRPASEMTAAFAAQEHWIVPGIIPTDGLVVLASSPKTGKTCFATALARAVAMGEPFLGMPVRQSPVLWCAHEETPPERELLHQGLTSENPLLVAYPGSIPPLPTRLPKTDRYGRRDLSNYDEPFIFQHAVSVGAKLIVIDCLHAAVEGAPLADNAVARAVMGTLRTWSFQLHVAVLVLHHLTKSGTRGHLPERFADSAQILAAATCHFFMDREEEAPTSTGGAGFSLPGSAGFILHEPQEPAGSEAQTSSRDSPNSPNTQNARSRITLHGRGRHPAPFARLEIVSNGILDYRMADEAVTAKPRRLGLEERVMNLLAEGWAMTSTEVAKKLNIHPSNARSALSALKEQAKIVTARAPKSRTRYSLPDFIDTVA